LRSSELIVRMQYEYKMNQIENVKGPGVFQVGSETVKELPRFGALSRLTDP
jgi:hypothetical protein